MRGTNQLKHLSSLEPLEERRLLAVALDADGWTSVTPSSDTHIIYVSSSTGSDANNGLSPSTPVKSLLAGISLLRSGMPDWLLLKRGDTWQESLGAEAGRWVKSGRSAQEPMLVSASR